LPRRTGLAAEALGKVKEEKAGESLIWVVKSDESWDVQEVTEEALGKIKAKKAWKWRPTNCT